MSSQTEEERLTWLKNRLRSVPEGASLLDFAEKNNIPIRFDASLDKNFGGMYHYIKKTVTLNPIHTEKILITSLVHELRHAWQGAVLCTFAETPKLKTKDYLVFLRMIEGDAFAFEAYMKDKLRLQHAPSFIKKAPAFIRKILGYGEPDFQKKMENEFVKFQKKSLSHNYDTRSLMIGLSKRLAPDKIDAIPCSKNLSDVFNNASALTPPSTPEQPGFLYMDAKNMDELAEKIFKHVPKRTRELSLRF